MDRDGSRTEGPWAPFNGAGPGWVTVVLLVAALPLIVLLPHPLGSAIVRTPLIGVLLFCLLGALSSPGWALRPDYFGLAVGAMTLWAFVSFLFALDPHTGLHGAIDGAMCGAMLLLARDSRTPGVAYPSHLGRAMVTAGASASIAAFVLPREFTGEPQGPFGNANVLAAYLLLTGPMSAAVLIAPHRLWRVMAGLSLAVQATCFVLIGSRMASVGLVVVLAVAVLASPRRTRLLVAIGAALAMACLVAMGAWLVVELRPESSSMRHRTFVWQTGARVLSAHPLTGAGPGNFPLAYRHSRPEFLGNSYVLAIPTDAHNDLLHAAAELGWPAALLLVGGFWGAVRKTRRRIVAENDRFSRLGLAALFGWGINGLANGSLFCPPVALTLAALVGVLCRPDDTGAPSPSAQPSLTMRWVIVLSGVVGLAAIESAALQYAVADLNARAGRYEAAVRWDPSWAWVVRQYAHQIGTAKPRAAEAALRRAVDRTPHDPDLHHSYAVVLSRLGDEAGARAHLATAARLDPYNPYFQRDLGRALVRHGQLDRARSALSRAETLFEMTLEVACSRYGPDTDSARSVEADLRATRSLLASLGKDAL